MLCPYPAPFDLRVLGAWRYAEVSLAHLARIFGDFA
jgi:hypothetical protein